MNIFVTGGAGFIGSAFVRHLIHNNSARVLNVDKLTYAGNLDSLESIRAVPRYKFAQADICDKEKMAELIEIFRPNAIVHLAAESHVDRSIDGPDAFLTTNLIGTGTLLQAALAYWQHLSADEKYTFRFLHVSTDEVFGDLGGSKDLFRETTPYAPSSPYAATKAGSDHLVRAWGRTYGLPILITNCSNNYGPYQFPEKLIPHMVLNALSGKPLPVYGDGNQVRDWLFVEDHARALEVVLQRGRVGETYNIGGRNEQKNLEVVRRICEILDDALPQLRQGKSFAELITFVKDRPGHDTRYAIDASKIQRDLGWMPHETFDSGIEKTVRWYLDNERWWQRVLDGSYQLKRIGTAA